MDSVGGFGPPLSRVTTHPLYFLFFSFFPHRVNHHSDGMGTIEAQLLVFLFGLLAFGGGGGGGVSGSPYLLLTE